MKNTNIFNLYNKPKNDETKFRCPSCGEFCTIDDYKCPNCSYDLNEYITTLFSPYKYLNSSYVLAQKEKFNEALIDIVKFLAYFPNNMDANKLYIYILFKLKAEDKFKHELELFEQKFSCNPWLMEILKSDYKEVSFPNIKEIKIECDNDISSVEKLANEYTNYRIKNINEIIELTIHFFDLLAILKRESIKDKNNISYKLALSFYENNYLNFLSKKEIRIENFNGRNYKKLTQDEIKCIDVIGTINIKELQDDEIVVIQPALYLRSKLLMKQRIYINKSDREKK